MIHKLMTNIAASWLSQYQSDTAIEPVNSVTTMGHQSDQLINQSVIDCLSVEH